MSDRSVIGPGMLYPPHTTFFVVQISYDGCAQSSFADLPATYSLPLKIVTRVWGDTVDKPVCNYNDDAL